MNIFFIVLRSGMPLINQISVDPEHGLNRTLYEMEQLEIISMKNSNFINFVKRTFDDDCISCIPGKIWNYVIDNFTYQSDLPYDEIIRAPHVLLSQKVGDCDDFALFIKTCLDVLGVYYTRYLLLGETNRGYSHILVFAFRGYSKGVYQDPVYLDGANKSFNVIPDKYKFYKIIG